MWGIENPLSVFEYINLGYQKNADFQMIAIMKNSKYLSFPVEDRKQVEARSESDNNFQITDVNIKSPNNPVQLIGTKVINYKI